MLGIIKIKVKLKNKFFSMTGNEHLINYKDYQEPLCNRCYSLGFPMRQESFMLCQKCGCVYSIKIDFTSGAGAEINNRKSK